MHGAGGAVFVELEFVAAYDLSGNYVSSGYTDDSGNYTWRGYRRVATRYATGTTAVYVDEWYNNVPFWTDPGRLVGHHRRRAQRERDRQELRARSGPASLGLSPTSLGTTVWTDGRSF